jgi:hypothetical protein
MMQLDWMRSEEAEIKINVKENTHPDFRAQGFSSPHLEVKPAFSVPSDCPFFLSLISG